jgi:hypothetical protein
VKIWPNRGVVRQLLFALLSFPPRKITSRDSIGQDRYLSVICKKGH